MGDGVLLLLGKVGESQRARFRNGRLAFIAAGGKSGFARPADELQFGCVGNEYRVVAEAAAARTLPGYAPLDRTVEASGPSFSSSESSLAMLAPLS